MYRRGAGKSGDGDLPTGITEAATALLYSKLGYFQLTADFLRLPIWRWVRRNRLSRAAILRRKFLKEGSFEGAILNVVAPPPMSSRPSRDVT